MRAITSILPFKDYGSHQEMIVETMYNLFWLEIFLHKDGVHSALGLVRVMVIFG